MTRKLSRVGSYSRSVDAQTLLYIAYFCELSISYQSILYRVRASTHRGVFWGSGNDRTSDLCWVF